MDFMSSVWTPLAKLRRLTISGEPKEMWSQPPEASLRPSLLRRDISSHAAPSPPERFCTSAVCHTGARVWRGSAEVFWQQNQHLQCHPKPPKAPKKWTTNSNTSQNQTWQLYQWVFFGHRWFFHNKASISGISTLTPLIWWDRTTSSMPLVTSAAVWPWRDADGTRALRPQLPSSEPRGVPRRKNLGDFRAEIFNMSWSIAKKKSGDLDYTYHHLSQSDNVNSFNEKNATIKKKTQRVTSNADFPCHASLLW